ncbi:MAG TPA: hypothetical protein PLI58_03380 [Candidatus Syntrophosphaera sp.]|jgi:hypothetical protein|nr:hypothetical protein [Candidatus Cloacimonadota bacterium]OQB92467.1 MAG: hypothetical protein BWX83_00123 [Candidatus Cloacimonetes bacterium ADurb.Bin117]HNU53920.1 hypothetical protein [Candidatus Syntrophosphaera sp.]HQN18516.1 hypothetical protein [Syntrophobacteraceae bacterium]MDI9524845.1 hypothetical protein [Candidatus Cloacimonadota bacterium]
MQFRYLKDLAIALLFISLLAFAIRLVTYNSKSTKVPDQSKYTNESVSDTLRNRIMSIEKSILERKNTVFTVAHDPLRQGNIIKDRFDLAKEFESALRNTFRPTGTYIDEETGKRLVTVEYQDKIYTGGVGDVIEGRRITWINEQNVGIYYGGPQTLSIQPRPQMPDFSQEELRRQNTDQNY